MKKPEDERQREPRDKFARNAILDAAERLFAEHGYDGVTLRHITQLAGTNIASVNYYFGSKESLFEEMIGRLFRPIDARRLQLLQTVLSHVEAGTPQLEPLLDAFARPFFESIADPEQDEPLRRMIARVLMETDGVAVRIVQVNQRRQVVFGLVVFSGAMIHLLASLSRFALLEPGIVGTPDNSKMFQLLVRCGVAAFDVLCVQPCGS